MGETALSLEFRDGGFREQVAVPLSDRGFRYGLALFETLRVSRGRALFLREHLEELRNSATRSTWWYGGGSFLDEALEAANQVLDGSGGKLPQEGVARLHLTAGDGGFTGEAEEPRFFLTAQERPAPDPHLYETGIGVRLHPEPVPSPSPGLKSQNYWPHLQALEKAKDRNYPVFQEAALANEDGSIRSFCLGNLFMVKGGRILTPSLASGCRRGVMRQWVIDRLDGSVEKTRISREELLAADSIFLTNSGYGVLPVSHLDDRELKLSARVQGLVATFQELL